MIYTFFGKNIKDGYLNSIERLDASKLTNGTSDVHWELIELTKGYISVRFGAFVAPINST